MEMEQIEADFGINLKDIPIQDIQMRLGEVEYIFNAKKGTWKTKVENQGNEKFEMDDKDNKGFDKKKRQKGGDNDNLNIEEMRFSIKTIDRQIKTIQEQIEVMDLNVQVAREKLKKVKQENDKLTYQYIDEHLETELLISQAQKIIQISKEITEEENKL